MSRDMFNNDLTKTDSFGTSRTQSKRSNHVHDFKAVEGQSVPECKCGAVREYGTQPAQPTPTTTDEWRVVPEPVAPVLAAIQDGDTIIASCMTAETADRIVADHENVRYYRQAYPKAAHALEGYDEERQRTLVAALTTALTHLQLPSELDQAIERPRVAREIEAALQVVSEGVER